MRCHKPGDAQYKPCDQSDNNKTAH
jgi:hypothetical protein